MVSGKWYAGIEVRKVSEHPRKGGGAEIFRTPMSLPFYFYLPYRAEFYCLIDAIKAILFSTFHV
jgi:hypothetical protein